MKRQLSIFSEEMLRSNSSLQYSVDLKIEIVLFCTNGYAITSSVHASANRGKYEVFVWFVFAYADFANSRGTNHSSGSYSILEFIPISRKNHPT